MNLYKSLVCVRSQLLHHNKSYVAGFSSIFDHKKDGTTPDKLSRSKDSTIEGSEGGYGGSGISEGGYGGSGIQDHRDKAAPTLNRDKRGGGDEASKDRNMEDAARDTAGSVAEMAKSGVVGAVEAGLKLGDMAKETMDSVYDATKRSGERVRDSAAGDDRRRQRDDSSI